MSTKSVEARKVFHEKMEKCHVVYKMKTLGDLDQRVTVAGYPVGENMLNIGVAIRYFKDDYDKAKAKEVACGRAIFNPEETVVIPNMDKMKIVDAIKDVKKHYELLKNMEYEAIEENYHAI